MITVLEILLLVGIFTYSFLVHKDLNSNNKKEEVIITPSSAAKKENKGKSTQNKVKNNEPKNINNEVLMDSDIDTKESNVEIIVKKENELTHKEKIKEIKKDNPVKKEEKPFSEEDELIYIMTEERLADIEKDEEDKEFLKNKIAFEKQMENNIEEELGDEIPVNYSIIFSQENKKKISEEIIQNTNLKWYEQNGDGSSIEQILPQDDFKVEEYEF